MASDIINLELHDPARESYVLNGYPILMKNLDRCIELLQIPQFVNWFYTRLRPGEQFCFFTRNGSRKRLLIEETKNNLEALREETEIGLALYKEIFSIIANVAKIEQAMEKRIQEMKHSGADILPLEVSYHAFCRNNKKFISKLSTGPGIFDEIDILFDTDFIINLCIHFRGIRAGVAPAVGGGLRGDVGSGIGRRIVRGAGIGALVCATDLILGSPSIAYTIATDSSSTVTIISVSIFVIVLILGGCAAFIGTIFSFRAYDRVRVRKLKNLSNSLIDMNILSGLKSSHVSLSKLTVEFKESIDSYENKVNSLITPGETPANLNEATIIYENTFEKHCKLGGRLVPLANVSKLQIAMATKAAETACGSFLKEKLSYSEEEVNDFLRKLQN